MLGDDGNRLTFCDLGNRPKAPIEPGVVRLRKRPQQASTLRPTERRIARSGCVHPDTIGSARACRKTSGNLFRLRADDVRGRSYAPRGKTPVVRPNHRRIGLGLISAVSNRGERRWMVLDGAIKAPMLIDFLQRLIRDARRKVFLILDRLPVHRAAVVREWLARHTRQIEVFYLPSYSPELNPDEGLNADLKQNVLRKAPMRSKQQLKQAAIRHMRRLAKSPARVRSFFHQNSMRYAA